jgi:hypothetical protein
MKPINSESRVALNDMKKKYDEIQNSLQKELF